MTVKTEPSGLPTTVVSSEDEERPPSNAGSVRRNPTVRCKVLLNASTVGITVQRCLGADEFPLQDGVEPHELIQLASVRTSYIELARQLADEFASGTGICYGANDFGTMLWGERVCHVLGPVAPAPLVGQPILNLGPWAPAFRGVHCSTMGASAPGHMDFDRQIGSLTYMLGLEAGGIVLRILMSGGVLSPEPEVSTHGYGILVTVFRKWLAPDALTVIEECVRQYLGVRLKRLPCFGLMGWRQSAMTSPVQGLLVKIRQRGRLGSAAWSASASTTGSSLMSSGSVPHSVQGSRSAPQSYVYSFRK